MTLPTLGQMLLGTEGLALLRQAFGPDPAARAARVAEIRGLLARYDAELSAPLDAPEYGLADGYRLWSTGYDQPLRLFPIETPPVQALLADLVPGEVLDAACGTGRHSLWLAGQGHRLTGIDASPSMLERARAKIPDGRFIEGDLTAPLPLPDAAFDAALSALALVHIADLGPVFSELARVLRPGGRLVISDVHPFLVRLGWQAQFRGGDGSTGFMRLNAHLLADYVQAATAAGLVLRSLAEPLLTADAARTVAQEPLPEANAAAWAGLPGVIVMGFEKPAMRVEKS